MLNLSIPILTTSVNIDLPLWAVAVIVLLALKGIFK